MNASAHWRSAACSLAATAIVFAGTPAWAQTPAAAAALTATPAALSSPAPATVPAALPTPQTAAPAQAAECVVPAAQARFEYPLSRFARRLAAGKPIKIVALGSSSTYGAGASSPAASYPSRLAAELTKRFPGHPFTVVNRGVNGEEARDMLARFDTGVIAEKPDVVIWQVGTNSVLRDNALQPQMSLLHSGIARLKAIGTDIILIDPQFAPRVIAKTNAKAMVDLIALIAKQESVSLFRRFDLMRHWHETERLPFTTFVSQDELHMNDWSYACVARALGMAIADAGTRPTATAGASQQVR